jgi:hypothetical protein
VDPDGAEIICNLGSGFAIDDDDDDEEATMTVTMTKRQTGGVEVSRWRRGMPATSA